MTASPSSLGLNSTETATHDRTLATSSSAAWTARYSAFDGVGTRAAPAANAPPTAAPSVSTLELTGNNVAGMDAIQNPASVIEFA